MPTERRISQKALSMVLFAVFNKSISNASRLKLLEPVLNPFNFTHFLIFLLVIMVQGMLTAARPASSYE